jgi:peptidoglycan/xylan/chitin deacetylase (PgdA/CDA1 family)
MNLTPEQEEAIFDKCVGLISDLAGKPPRGYVAPWWEFGPCSNGRIQVEGCCE